MFILYTLCLFCLAGIAVVAGMMLFPDYREEIKQDWDDSSSAS